MARITSKHSGIPRIVRTVPPEEKATLQSSSEEASHGLSKVPSTSSEAGVPVAVPKEVWLVELVKGGSDAAEANRDVLALALEEAKGREDVAIKLCHVTTSVPFPLGGELPVSQVDKRMIKKYELQVFQAMIQPQVNFAKEAKKASVTYLPIYNDKRGAGIVDASNRVQAKRLYLEAKKSSMKILNELELTMPGGSTIVAVSSGRRLREIRLANIEMADQDCGPGYADRKPSRPACSRVVPRSDPELFLEEGLPGRLEAHQWSPESSDRSRGARRAPLEMYGLPCHTTLQSLESLCEQHPSAFAPGSHCSSWEGQGSVGGSDICDQSSEWQVSVGGIESCVHSSEWQGTADCRRMEGPTPLKGKGHGATPIARLPCFQAVTDSPLSGAASPQNKPGAQLRRSPRTLLAQQSALGGDPLAGLLDTDAGAEQAKMGDGKFVGVGLLASSDPALASQGADTAAGLEVKPIPIAFSVPQVFLATDSFAPGNFMGSTPAASLYQGQFNGCQVAAAQLTQWAWKDPFLFKAVVHKLAATPHANVACLMGSCPESRTLVYWHTEGRGTLAQRLKGATAGSGSQGKGQLLSWRQRLVVLGQVSKGLAWAHSQHPPWHTAGTLSPELILLDSSGNSQVCLAGVAGLAQDEALACQWLSQRKGGVLPECLVEEEQKGGRVSGGKEVDVRHLDSYAFGLLIIQLAACTTEAEEEAQSLLATCRTPTAGAGSKEAETLLRLSLSRAAVHGCNWPLAVLTPLVQLALLCTGPKPWKRPALVDVRGQVRKIMASA